MWDAIAISTTWGEILLSSAVQDCPVKNLGKVCRLAACLHQIGADLEASMVSRVSLENGKSMFVVRDKQEAALCCLICDSAEHNAKDGKAVASKLLLELKKWGGEALTAELNMKQELHRKSSEDYGFDTAINQASQDSNIKQFCFKCEEPLQGKMKEFRDRKIQRSLRSFVPREACLEPFFLCAQILTHEPLEIISSHRNKISKGINCCRAHQTFAAQCARLSPQDLLRKMEPVCWEHVMKCVSTIEPDESCQVFRPNLPECTGTIRAYVLSHSGLFVIGLSEAVVGNEEGKLICSALDEHFADLIHSFEATREKRNALRAAESLRSLS